MITNEHEVGAPYVNFSSALNTFTQSKDAILILDGYMIAFCQISANEPMMWTTIENEPLNEYQISHLATMAFPTLFPDGKGDPTNQALLRDIPLQERVKHLLKFAEFINGKWCIVLLSTLGFHTGLSI